VIEVRGPLTGQSAVCGPILRALPDWFGIEKATQELITQTDSLPTFVAYAGAAATGFLTLKQHTPYAAEILVMGVLPAAHRQGVGRALVAQAEGFLRAEGVEFLQVKTLSSSDPDPHYARTRAFYAAQGFRPLEELPTLWDEANPCLLLVKALSAPSQPQS
jgi:ribosomal protein S18 acetylase RimI-like enzyme